MLRIAPALAIISTLLPVAQSLAQATEAEIVRDGALYADIVDGGTDRLALYLSTGGNRNAKIGVPESDAYFELTELAVRSKNEDAALLLLSAGLAPSDSRTLIEIAAANGLAQVVRTLVSQDPDRVRQMRAEYHPLISAIERGDVELGVQLVEWVAQYDSRPKMQNVLDAALVAGTLCNPPAVTMFLAAGANPREIYRNKSVLEIPTGTAFVAPSTFTRARPIQAGARTSAPSGGSVTTTDCA